MKDPTKLEVTSDRPGVSNTWPAGRMWPARAFCATRDAFWEFLKN